MEFTEVTLKILSEISQNLNPIFWKDWTFWSALSSIITGAFIGWQAYQTKKSTRFLEYQIRPAAYPLLLRNDKKTILYVRNDSKLKVLFNLKVIDKENNKLIQDFRSKPLNVFPGGMQYPDALLSLDETIKSKKEGVYVFEYKTALGNAPKQEFRDYPKDEWEFQTDKWVGPDGIEPSGVISLISNNCIRNKNKDG